MDDLGAISGNLHMKQWEFHWECWSDRIMETTDHTDPSQERLTRSAFTSEIASAQLPPGTLWVTLWGFTNPTIASTCWCVGLIWDRQFTMAGIRSIHPPIPIRSWWTAHGWDPGSRNPTYGSSIDISISRSTGVLDVFLSNHSLSHAACLVTKHGKYIKSYTGAMSNCNSMYVVTFYSFQVHPKEIDKQSIMDPVYIQFYPM